MCAHACDFHTRGVSPRTPCCVPCSCGENIELTKMETHLSNCHRVGLDVPKFPIDMPILPSASISVPEPAYR